MNKSNKFSPEVPEGAVRMVISDLYAFRTDCTDLPLSCPHAKASRQDYLGLECLRMLRRVPRADFLIMSSPDCS